ncbi:hypothetical protein [Streptomyces sennicomposti]
MLENVPAMAMSAPLWRTGESFPLARERLASLREDPSAGAASRGHMLTAFEGVESLVPTPARIELFNRHTAVCSSATPLTLAEGFPADEACARHIRRRSVETGPLRRAAVCALVKA